MRQVVLQFITSLDGYRADAGNGIRDVMMSIDDPEQEKYALSRLWQAGTHIMGRVSYQEMAPFWHASSLPAAAPMNDIPKVVFSRTLRSAGWPARCVATRAHQNKPHSGLLPLAAIEGLAKG